jgi:exonuclease III
MRLRDHAQSAVLKCQRGCDPGICVEQRVYAFARLKRWGLADAYRVHHPEPGRYTWWDYRAGNFHKNFGMRIDHLLVTRPVADRTVWAEIDREARKGKPLPSDHAPLVIDTRNSTKDLHEYKDRIIKLGAGNHVPSFSTHDDTHDLPGKKAAAH